jgi:hypothetical protein
VGNTGTLGGSIGLKLELEGTRVVVGGFSGDVGLEGVGRGLYEPVALLKGARFSGVNVPTGRLCIRDFNEL